MKITVENAIELDTVNRITIDGIVGDTLELLVSTGSAEYNVYLKPHELIRLLEKGYFEFKQYGELL
jgi:hypothetical protein